MQRGFHSSSSASGLDRKFKRALISIQFIDGLPLSLFGGHVGRRSQDLAGLSQVDIRLVEPGQPEIKDLDLAAGIPGNVLLLPESVLPGIFPRSARLRR